MAEEKPQNEFEKKVEPSVSNLGEKSLRDLLEKNLKWSQIIYEQNRKINSKLFWSTLGGWVRLFFFLAILALALIYIPPIVKKYYSEFTSVKTATSSYTVEQLLKLLQVDPAKQDQIKTILK